MSVIYLGIWWGGQSEQNPAFLSQNIKCTVYTRLPAAVSVPFSIRMRLFDLPFASTETLPNILASFKVLKSFFS